MIELKVSGMDCTNCAESINRFLSRKGLKQVFVNFATGEVRFEENDSALTLDQVKAGIEKLGYHVLEGDKPLDWWTLEHKLLVSAIFTAPLLLNHLLMSLGLHLWWMHNAWVQFAFCLPVFAIGCWFFGRSAWNSIRNGLPNMDVLIFLGSSAAFVYSLVGTIANEPEYIFYETAATIITLVLVGNLMEHRSVMQTTTAIDELSKLQVEKARRIMPSGSIVIVERDEIQKGNKLQVNEGDLIPADGVILSGNGFVDESMLTGESIPIEKKEGDALIGASLLAKGNVVMEVRAVGKETVLSQMILLVKSAQQDKPQIQKLADRISAVFVPVVVSIAVLTFLISWGLLAIPFRDALMHSIAVLVISCPCAMGLATPTAVMVGVGRLARNGILIKGAQTLETFASIRNIVFDKTGTLTTGHFRIREIDYLGNQPELVNAIIRQLEQRSSHPVAQSILRELEGKGNKIEFPLQNIEEEKGVGMRGEDTLGDVYFIGSARKNGSLNGNAGRDLYLWKNETMMATIDIEDELKDDAASTIQYLQKQQFNLILLSGDKKLKTEVIARELGIREYYSEQLPAEKLERIASLSNNAPTAMVGDGINDAPALAKATIGVSLSNASQVAIQSSQIVLLKGKLDYLRKAVGISRATLQTIRQNLFWAFAYNIVAIPIAAMGYLNPMWGALFMAFSDVIVIGNSLRLKVRKVD